MRLTPLLFLFLAAGTAAAQAPQPSRVKPRAKPPAKTPMVVPMPRIPDVEMPAALAPFHFDSDHWTFELLTPALAEIPHALEAMTLELPHLEHTPEALDLLEAAQAMTVTTPEPVLWDMHSGGETRGTSAWLTARPDQGSAEDSLYRSAHQAFRRGEYPRASTLFQSFEQKYPRSRVAAAALYYRAFALYRAGSTAELNAALEALKAQQQKYPSAASDSEAASLRARILAALAARGDRGAQEALRAASAQGAGCDREEMEVRASALSALVQVNPDEARPTLQKVLSRRDECSVTLRRRAVYLMGRAGTEAAAGDLLAVAKNDPDPSVRGDAIAILARTSGAASVRTLEELFGTTTDERTRRTIINALHSNGTPEARRALRTIIERDDLPDGVRNDAIMSLSRTSARRVDVTVRSGAGQNVRVEEGERPVSPEAAEDATYLRNLYAKTTTRSVKSSIISAVARIGGPVNEEWLMGIVRNRDEEMPLRREAISRLRPTTLSVEEIGRLFDALAERDLRFGLINQLARRDEPAATDKLIEIARSGTDPELRRAAIQALARKKDPRSTKLLLDLVEKP